MASYVIGFGIGVALFGGLEVAKRYFRRHPLSRRQHAAFFAVSSILCALWCIALWGVWWVFAGMAAISACLAWESVGTALEWRGFRPEPDLECDEDDETAEPIAEAE